MRRLLTIECEGALLGATLDAVAGAPRPAAVLMATGGTQTRAGSHRMYERLARALAAAGYTCLRFDRRGVGDSEGDDPGFRLSGADLAAAAAALRREAPHAERLIGFGLCDGATALALHGGAAGLGGLILVNPWLVEAEAGTPAPAAVRRHYAGRLASAEGWKKLLTGAFDVRKLLAGLRRSADTAPSAIAGDAAATLRETRLPTAVVLCEGDATAIAAERELRRRPFRGLVAIAQRIPSDSHTFARPGDHEALFGSCLALLRRLGG
ncbi:MAG TPA: hydrolase 1, exosortase A system-associated [Allosphingosinicella sp.]|jgi:exosortase A-associated hydrolase 1